MTTPAITICSAGFSGWLGGWVGAAVIQMASRTWWRDETGDTLSTGRWNVKWRQTAYTHVMLSSRRTSGESNGATQQQQHQHKHKCCVFSYTFLIVLCPFVDVDCCCGTEVYLHRCRSWRLVCLFVCCRQGVNNWLSAMCHWPILYWQKKIQKFSI